MVYLCNLTSSGIGSVVLKGQRSLRLPGLGVQRDQQDLLRILSHGGEELEQLRVFRSRVGEGGGKADA